MAENFTITFNGIDSVSSIIQDIIDKINELDNAGGEASGDGPSIIIDATQATPEIEEVMWEILGKIKTRAVEDGTEFLLDSSG